jgi:hypothetical protein
MNKVGGKNKVGCALRAVNCLDIEQPANSLDNMIFFVSPAPLRCVCNLDNQDGSPILPGR